jgi:hypothetical protein
LPLDVKNGVAALPLPLVASTGKPQVEEAALRDILDLHAALAAGQSKVALLLLQAGLLRQAASLGVPEKLYREGVAQLIERILAGKDLIVAPLAPAELEYLHGPGDVVLVQRRGYGRSPVILAHSSAGELSGELHWIGGAPGVLQWDLRLIPKAVQWQH